ATLEIKDALTRVDGVGSITVFGSRDYSMRIWIDPSRLQSLGLTANDVTLALQGQNIQVASGILNQPPVDKAGAFQISVQTLGRLADPDQFADVVVKQTANAVVRLKDVASVELAGQDYSSNSYLNTTPAVAIPVSLVGTFFLMAMFGFSLNNLSLFGLVLAVGIVVDDAIVVVENVERNIALGLSPRDAAMRSMDEVGGALVAIALVLCAVFIPSAFITGISGQFYKQFALTIAGATVISLAVSLTLSPALCALLLRPHQRHETI